MFCYHGGSRCYIRPINLYYTDARFDTRFGIKTTTNLTEGSNLYYTEARVSANTDVKANSDYRGVGHLPLAGGIMTGEVTWDTDIEIPTWSSNTVYTPSDDPNWLISSSSFFSSSYQTFEAFNKTVDAGGADCWISASGKYNSNGTVSASTYNTTQVDGSNSYRGEWIQVQHTEKKLRLTSFILTARSLYTEYSKYYRLLGTNDDPTGSPNWTTLMYNTTQLVWGSPGASLVLTPETRLGYYNTYRLLITQCTISYCSIARFIPSFVTEGTVIDGTSINGADIDTLIADVSDNTAYAAVGHLPLAGGALSGNLDMGNYDIDNVNQVFIDRKGLANNKIVLFDNGSSSTTSFYGFGIQGGTLLYNVSASGDNHKFYYGGTNELFRIGNAGIYSYRNSNITGDLTVSGETNIGGAKISRGATNGLQLYGTSGNLSGPHLQIFVSTDTYPTYQMLNWIHNDINMAFDGYFDGAWRSSSTTSNLLINKAATTLTFLYDSGIAPGSAVTWNTGFSMDLTNGLVSCNKGLDVTGNITLSGTVDGVDISNLETAVSANTAKVSYPSADSTKVGFISVTQAVNLDTMESDIANKVSADGSINTHSDVNITAPADGHVLTYDTGEWKNLAPADVTGYLPLDGTTAMTGTLNIDPTNHGEKVIFYETTPTEVPYGIQTSNGYIMHGVEYNGSHVFIYDIDGKLATAGYTLQLNRLGSIMNTELSMNNHKITDLTTPTDTADATTKGYVDTAVNAKLSVNGTSIMIGNLNMGNYDIDNVNQVFINRSTTANNKLVLYDNGSGSTTDFYGFGIQSATLMYNVNSTGANHKFYYAGVYELFRIGHSGIYSYRNLDVTGNITVSGTVDGIDIQALNTTVGGKLSLTGGTVTGDLTVNGEINVGGAKIARGASNGLQLNGTSGNIVGPHIQVFVSTDTYPVFQQLNWTHNNINMCFDSYYDGAWRSSSTNSNAMISKGSTTLNFNYDSGIGLGSTISWNTGISMSTTNGNTTITNVSGGSVIHRGRPSYPFEGQTSWRRSGNSGEACIGYNGNLLAWTITNQTGEPGTNYTYVAPNAGGWSVGSDRRLKSNILDMDIKDCCGKICQLKPRTYYMKSDEEKKNCLGFLADEMKAVYPELVTNSGLKIGDAENLEGINYTGMIPILVGSIQSILAEVKALKAEVELLKNPV